MDITFSELRQKEVINITDGKRLGRVCDVVFLYPENTLQGLIVPQNKGLRFFTHSENFIEMKFVKKIGEDAILVEIKDSSPPPKKNKCPPPCNNCCNDHKRRSYEEYE